MEKTRDCLLRFRAKCDRFELAEVHLSRDLNNRFGMLARQDGFRINIVNLRGKNNE